MVEFNKMFVMLPVMFLARKLDSEDPMIVFYLRLSYAFIQVISVLIVAYTYLQASAVQSNSTVYVPAPAVPFADPNAKKKYTETIYSAHVLSAARSLLGSTLFGICLTVGLHYYKGMVMGLAIQTVMAPLNLIENPLVKALFFSATRQLRPEDKIFHEKLPSELTADDDVVDEQGNPIVRPIAGGKATTAGAASQAVTTTADAKKSLEEILLDTWDAGSKADLTPLLSVLDSKNCNYQTKEDSWTPLMILAGLGAKGTASAIRHLLNELHANPAMVDKEGWNAMHWAAFHGSVDGAKEMLKQTAPGSGQEGNAAASALLNVKDKEGFTPLETARKEGNDAVADLLEQAMGESKKSK